MQQSAEKLVVMSAMILAVASCSTRTNATQVLEHAADQLSQHPCLKTARLQKIADRDVAAIAFCEKGGLVVFYRPGMAGGADKIGTINVNEPVSSLPAYMNISQPSSKLESEIGPPDRKMRNRSFQTLSYEMKDGLKVDFDVLPNGSIGHITFYFPDS